MRLRSGARAASVAILVVSTVIGLSQAAEAKTGRFGAGYWSTDTAGLVYTVGDAAHFGDLRAVRLRAPISGIAGAPGGQGYWLAARDGGVFTFGSARFRGSAANLPLNAPVVGIAATPTGNGYWLVAADGGVFTYGDAKFYGSAGNLSLRAPVVGIAATPTGHGYWLAASDGGVFTYGDAKFYGSAGGVTVNSPIVGIAAHSSGLGYWLVTRARGVRGYGHAPTLEANFDGPAAIPAVAIAASPYGDGFAIRHESGGFISAFGTASHCDGEDLVSPPGPVVGMAVAFDKSAVAGALAATQCDTPLGGVTGAFPVSSPWHIDASGPGLCEISVSFMDRDGGGIPLRLETSVVDRAGRLEMRAVQMNGDKTFQVYARGRCLFVARPGTGGAQTLPFTTKSGGDSLPFSSASPITIAATGKCTVDVYANDDGRRIAGRTGSSFTFQVPAGTYFVSSSLACTVTVT